MFHQKSERSHRAILSLVFLTVFLDMVGIGIVFPIFPILFFAKTSAFFPVEVSFATRSIAYGLLMATYPLLQFFGAPILGAMSDRFGRKIILVLSLSGTFLGYALAAISIVYGNLPLLFLSRIIDGFTGGNISVAQSAIADISDERSKVKNFGLMGMAFGLGFILGPFLGGKLGDSTLVSWFRPETPLWFAAMLSCITIILVLFLFPETLHTRVQTKISALTGFRNIRKAFGLRNLRSMFIVIFFLTLGFTSFTQFFQVRLVQEFHFTQGQIGNLFAFVGICIAVVQGGVTRLVSNRWKPEQVLRFSAPLLGLALLMLLVPKTSLGVYMLMPLIALSQGLTAPNSVTIVSNLSDRSSQGEVLGINQSITSLAMTLPPILAGFISAIHPTFPLLMASFFTFSAWIVFVLTFQKKPKALFHEIA